MKKLIIYILLLLNVNIFAITTTYKTNLEIPGSVNIGTQLYLDNQPIGDYVEETIREMDTIPLKLLKFDTNAYMDNHITLMGEVRWNYEDGTIDVGMNKGEVIQQVGLETFYRVKNQSGELIENGRLVMFDGSNGMSGLLRVKKATGNIDGQYIMGIATENIENDSFGFVTKFGKVRGINTTGSIFGEVWNDSDVLWYNPDTIGGLTNIKPEYPKTRVMIAVVVNTHSTNGEIFVRPTYNFTEELESDKILMDTESLFNLSNAWQSRFGAGRLYGGEITNNGDGTVHIDSGCGIVKTVAGQIEEIPTSYDSAGISANKYVCWDSIPALALTDNAYNYIYYDGSEDTIKATTNFYSISFYEDFTIGRAYRANGEIVVRLCGTNLWNFDRRVQLFGEEVFPVVRGTGLILADEGTRYISVTSGILWAELVNRFSINAFNSMDASDSFTYWWTDGIGGYNSAKDSSQIDNLRYDNAGTLTELGNNKYGVFWVYVVHDGSVHIVYGTGSYSLSEAQAVNPPNSIPGLLNAYASLIGKIIILKSASEITEVSSAFTKTFSSSIVQNHNDLGGLNVGDYLHLTAAEKAEFDTINDSFNLKLDIADSIVITKVSQLENDSNFASVDVSNTFTVNQKIISADTNGAVLTLQNLSGENIEIKAIGDYNYSIGWSGNFGKLTSGQFNIALGLSQSENKTGNNNIGIGNGTLNNKNLLDDNIAIGRSSQFNLYSSYSENTSLGSYSLYAPKGSYNTAIGAWSGAYNFGLEIDLNPETGCIYLGAYSTSKNASSENEIVIGYQAVGEGSNTIMIGNDTILTTYIKGKITGDGSGLVFNDTIIYNSEILYESDTYNYYLEVSDTSLGFDISNYNISIEVKDTTTISGVEVWTGNYGSEFEGYMLDNTVYRVYSVLRNYLVGEIRIRVYR